MGNIFCHMTATAVKWTGEGNDDYEELHGWVDPARDERELFESRNDVAPVINLDENDEDLVEEIRDLNLTCWEDNGDGTFYMQDEVFDFEGGWAYLYAVHFKRKRRTSKGWIEEPWHPDTVLVKG